MFWRHPNLFAKRLKLLEDFRRDVVAQLSGLVGVFEGKCGLPVFKVGNGQVVVRHGKIRRQLQGFEVGLDAFLDLTVHQVGIGQGGEGLDKTKVEHRRLFQGIDGLFHLTALQHDKANVAPSFGKTGFDPDCPAVPIQAALNITPLEADAAHLDICLGQARATFNGHCQRLFGLLDLSLPKQRDGKIVMGVAALGVGGDGVFLPGNILFHVLSFFHDRILFMVKRCRDGDKRTWVTWRNGHCQAK
ncbi:hypothetical protein DESC_720264 [Desulfosarcina cetonica]|nr:hypothetical protein DESC_720264 [Desulfosarcina cetonica]